MISVFGLGFVGLTTALGFAQLGFQVYGVEKSLSRRQMLREKTIPFAEPSLREQLETHLGGPFQLVDSVQEAVENSGIVYYCVGTPCGPDGAADLTDLFAALDETMQYKQEGEKLLLVIKSTVPPGTVENRVLPYLEAQGWKNGVDFSLANNPEFLREGHCWEDFIHADRVVIGCSDDWSEQKLRMLYEKLGAPVCAVSCSTAEFIKYLSNSLLATMISYANEMSEVAERIGKIDTAEAFHILHMDGRWAGAEMASYVYPGCGYGGYCLPKDTKALYALANSIGLQLPLLGSVIQTNEQMPEVIAKRIMQRVSQEQQVGILGLSFKPGSNDVRDCTSAKVIRLLLEHGYRRIIAYDPIAIPEFQSCYPLDIQYADSLDEICDRSDKLVILTGWPEFKAVKAGTPDKVLDYRYL